MNDLFLVLSVVLVLVALWLLVFKAREWERRARVYTRLHDTAGARVEREGNGFWLWRLSGALTESSLAASDYEDIRLALKGMGKTREQSQVIYLLSCWLLPVFVAAIGFLFFGALGGVLTLSLIHI